MIASRLWREHHARQRVRTSVNLLADATGAPAGALLRRLIPHRPLCVAVFATGIAVSAPRALYAQSGIAWAVAYHGGNSGASATSGVDTVRRAVEARGRTSTPVLPVVVARAGATSAPSSATSRVARTGAAGTRGVTTRNVRAAALPDVAEAQVAQWATAYSTVYRESFVRSIERAQPYGAMIATKLRRAGLPGALIYLPVVESRFSAHARSHAGAVGLWQFMPGTARGYGLRVDAWVDERRDPYRATDAAVRYLHDLHATFGDWYLALAAYNSGDGRVSRAVRSSGARGSSHAFWMAQAALPRETREYVPQLLGVARVGANPARFGIDLPAAQPTPDVVRVLLPPASRLTVLANVWGISLDEIARLNPALNWAATPPDQSYPVVLPAADAEHKRDTFMALPHDARVLTRAEVARIAGQH